jgi:hypothetical protein
MNLSGALPVCVIYVILCVGVYVADMLWLCWSGCVYGCGEWVIEKKIYITYISQRQPRVRTQL